MPVYQYEPDDRDCLMCDGRVEVIQAVAEAPLQYCPHCGLEVRRIISPVTFRLGDAGPPMDRAGRRGFTTYRRAEKGLWERVDGVGPDAIAGTKEDMAAVEAEKCVPKRIDLDAN